MVELGSRRSSTFFGSETEEKITFVHIVLHMQRDFLDPIFLQEITKNLNLNWCENIEINSEFNYLNKISSKDWVWLVWFGLVWFETCYRSVQCVEPWNYGYVSCRSLSRVDGSVGRHHFSPSVPLRMYRWRLRYRYQVSLLSSLRYDSFLCSFFFFLILRIPFLLFAKY